MAPLIYGIALGMIWQSEDLLDPQGAQQLSPNITDELSAAVGEELARSAEVGDHVAQEGFAHSVRGVIAGWNEDGVFRIAIHKHDEEFLAVIRRQRSHNVNGQRIPGTLRLDSIIIINRWAHHYKEQARSHWPENYRLPQVRCAHMGKGKERVVQPRDRCTIKAKSTDTKVCTQSGQKEWSKKVYPQSI